MWCCQLNSKDFKSQNSKTLKLFFPKIGLQRSIAKLKAKIKRKRGFPGQLPKNFCDYFRALERRAILYITLGIQDNEGKIKEISTTR